jgi:hypothetical protein
LFPTECTSTNLKPSIPRAKSPLFSKFFIVIPLMVRPVIA